MFPFCSIPHIEIQKIEMDSSLKQPIKHPVSQVNDACLSLFATSNLDEFRRLFDSSILQQLGISSFAVLFESLRETKFVTKTINLTNQANKNLALIFVFNQPSSSSLDH